MRDQIDVFGEHGEQAAHEDAGHILGFVTLAFETTTKGGHPLLRHGKHHCDAGRPKPLLPPGQVRFRPLSASKRCTRSGVGLR